MHTHTHTYTYVSNDNTYTSNDNTHAHTHTHIHTHIHTYLTTMYIYQVADTHTEMNPTNKVALMSAATSTLWTPVYCAGFVSHII